jgi:uncharacterized protein HemX
MNITEATFRLMDVIYIAVGVGSGLAFYWKMVMNDNKRKYEINQLKIDAEKYDNTMKANISKNESIMFKKFSSVHSRMDKNEEKNKTELDLINRELADVKVGISSINGKLDILISQKQQPQQI